MLDKSNYVDAYELARRIAYLSHVFSTHKLQFPLLSWNYVGDLVDLENELHKINIMYKICYDSSVEPEYSICLITNVECSNILKLDMVIWKKIQGHYTFNCKTPNYYHGEYYPTFPFNNVEVPDYSFPKFKMVANALFPERGTFIIEYNENKIEF